MYKLIGLVMICLLFSSCSLLKIAASPFKSSVSNVPQQTEKSTKKMKCRGNIEMKDDGSVYCSDGFYLYQTNDSSKERALSFREKIGQWIMKASGMIFWLVVIGIVLTMTGFGWVISAVFQGIFGLGRVLRQVVSGIQKAKNNGGDFVTALNASTDEDVKKFIAQFKLNNNIK